MSAEIEERMAKVLVELEDLAKTATADAKRCKENGFEMASATAYGEANGILRVIDLIAAALPPIPPEDDFEEASKGISDKKYRVFGMAFQPVTQVVEAPSVSAAINVAIDHPERWVTHSQAGWSVSEIRAEPCADESAHDSWDDPKYVKPADCDESGYCVDCRSATVHRDGCSIRVGEILGLQRAMQVTNCKSCRQNIRALANRIREDQRDGD